MHPQDYRSIVDHLYDAYCSLHEEIHRLRKENKALNDELGKFKTLNSTLNAKLCNMSTKRILKMGAEWFLDGELLLNISLMRRIKFVSPICNVKISEKGQIAFTCNSKIFLLQEKKIFNVENSIKEFDMKTMRYDLVELERREFVFIGEDIVIKSGNSVIKFKDMEREWVLNLKGVIYLCVDQSLIYIGVEEGYIHMYTAEGNFIKTVEVNGEFNKFMVCGGGIMVVSRECVMILPSFIHLSQQRIIGSEFDGRTVYHGGTGGIVNFSMPSGSELQTYETQPYKSSVLSIMKYRGFLFVATEDRIVTVTELETKKTMRIVLTDNVIDMCCNENSICFVDNNGGLRVWRV